MELVERLEKRFEELLNKVAELQEENQHLREQLESEKAGRQEVSSRIETLLERIQGEIG